MNLYRITLSGEMSELWKSKHVSELSEIQIQRVYRWGPFWGILNRKTNQWRVETREQIMTQPYLFEKVKEYDLQAPPHCVDDIWEEEIQTQNQLVSWNGDLVSVCLPANELKTWCKKENLESPECLSSVLEIPIQRQSLPSHQSASHGMNGLNRYTQGPKSNHKHHHKTHNTSHKVTQSGICYIED